MRISDWSSDVCSSDLVVIGNRRAQRCRSWFEQDGAGVGDRGPEDRLVESRKCRVRSERITPNARRSCVLVRRSSALCEQVHSKIPGIRDFRSEEHTSELQSLMRISYAVFCLKKKK